jgi:hypothetical protein
MTAAPMTLSQLLAASRVFDLREAAVATLKPLFPDCEVRAHLGRLDMADVETGETYSAPSMHIGVTRQPSPEHRMSGLRDVRVELARLGTLRWHRRRA